MTYTYESLRNGLDTISDRIAEWQGLPVPLDELPLRLHDRHPLASMYRGIDGDELALLVGGPTLGDDEDERIVNHWVDRRRGYEVYVLHRLPSGRAFALKAPLPPEGAMDRLTMWLKMVGAADAWDEGAEEKARTKLRGMLGDRQWHQYNLTGSFLETSKRSRVTYLFRRSRPTVALSPRWRERASRPDLDTMRCLAVLCLHPIGYYDRTWAGCLVPSDDVIAHLVMVRADEAHFWAKANQHDPAAPEAGL